MGIDGLWIWWGYEGCTEMTDSGKQKTCYTPVTRKCHKETVLGRLILCPWTKATDR